MHTGTQGNAPLTTMSGYEMDGLFLERCAGLCYTSGTFHLLRGDIMATGRDKDRKTRKKHRKNVKRMKALAKARRGSKKGKKG
jgi:hypothetical protein